MTEEFSSIAGHRVLDLMNTVDWRLSDDRGERLADDDAALRWARQFGVITEREARKLRRFGDGGNLAAALRGVRELAYAAAHDGDEKAAAELQRLHRLWQLRAELVSPGKGRAGWAFTDGELDGETLPLRVARHAVELLLSPDGAQVSQCADDQCGWVYLDTSRRRNRRWCSAEGCGARNRARRHYERVRRRAADGAPDTSVR